MDHKPLVLQYPEQEVLTLLIPRDLARLDHWVYQADEVSGNLFASERMFPDIVAHERSLRRCRLKRNVNNFSTNEERVVDDRRMNEPGEQTNSQEDEEKDSENDDNIGRPLSRLMWEF
jgi:hypothetical protein